VVVLTVDDPATITVRGEAVVRVAPDQALLSVMLEALDESPGAALADVTQRSDALIRLLDELGIEREDRSTTGVAVHEEFDHTPNGRRSQGYRARASVSVRSSDPAKIGSVISRAGDQLGASITGPRWYVSPGNPARLDAAREAALNARHRAEAFTAGLGAKLGRAVELREPDAGDTGPVIRRASARAAVAASGGPPELPIEAGEHDVTAAILATFTIENG
jgi:uncharacterized protein